jgi:hypothetical protein
MSEEHGKMPGVYINSPFRRVVVFWFSSRRSQQLSTPVLSYDITYTFFESSFYLSSRILKLFSAFAQFPVIILRLINLTPPTKIPPFPAEIYNNIDQRCIYFTG